MKSEEITIETIKNMDPPPLAWMPREVFFKAEFCGSDTYNYIYIKTADTGSVENYANLRTCIDKKYGKLGEKNLPEAEIIPDCYIILKEDRFYYRAKVTRKDDDRGLIYCLKIDEGICSVAGFRQIYPMPHDLMKIPCCTIRCRLQGMDFFDDLPHLELGYKLIKMSEIMIRPLYSVEVLGIMDDVPYINLSRYGMGLANAIQKFIPLLCEPQVPKSENPFDGEILYANTKACVWIRQYGDDGLSSKIVESLKRYKIIRDIVKQERALAKDSLKNGVLVNGFGGYSSTKSGGGGSSNEGSLAASSTPTPVSNSMETTESAGDPDFFLMPEELWKEKYLEFPTGIFVAEYLDDLYRVRVLKKFQKNKVEVEFIDFGNRQYMSRKKLIPVQKIDENLAFIPPQCFKARLHGFYRMNTFYFWQFLPSHSLSIVIKDLKGDEECGMEVDIVRVQEEEKNAISISETWRTSSPDKLALCNIMSLDIKSTGVTNPVPNQRDSMMNKPFPLHPSNITIPGRMKHRGALYRVEGIAMDHRLKRL